MGIVLLGFAVLASGQSYPTGPDRVVVPFPAGGGNDSMGRILSQKLTEHSAGNSSSRTVPAQTAW
ncbi:MAG TPA: hypothetical protein VGP15_04230, partial [Burkholderiales bacterium]|nr:hypothetical protein [Burkholderiales bacterium]